MTFVIEHPGEPITKAGPRICSIGAGCSMQSLVGGDLGWGLWRRTVMAADRTGGWGEPADDQMSVSRLFSALAVLEWEGLLGSGAPQCRFPSLS